MSKPNTFNPSPNVQIFFEDCITGMRDRIEEASVNLIFADPPYNLSGKKLKTTFSHGGWTKINEKWDIIEDYPKFTKAWLSEAFRVLTPNGVCFISGTYHNIFDIVILAKKIGFILIQDLIWFKRTSVPSISRKVYRHSSETLLFLVKSKDYSFNYDNLKLLNNDKQMRNVWSILKVGASETVKHPSQKPEELLLRILIGHTNEDDLVLDPFLGSGTTARVCQILSRHFIGFEVEDKYQSMIKNRLNQEPRFAAKTVQKLFEDYKYACKNKGKQVLSSFFSTENNSMKK